MKSLPILFISLFMLNGCAYYSNQFGIGGEAKFCSNLEEDRDLKNEKYFISDTQFFYLTKSGNYYSEKEFNQLTSPTLVNVSYGGVSAKELEDTAKKVFTVKYTNVKTNANICAPKLISDDGFEKSYRNSILGRKVLISTDKGESSSGKEIYSDVSKKNLLIQYL